jgi:hypothetical protein
LPAAPRKEDTSVLQLTTTKARDRVRLALDDWPEGSDIDWRPTWATYLAGIKQKGFRIQDRYVVELQGYCWALVQRQEHPGHAQEVVERFVAKAEKPYLAQAFSRFVTGEFFCRGWLIKQSDENVADLLDLSWLIKDGERLQKGVGSSDTPEPAVAVEISTSTEGDQESPSVNTPETGINPDLAERFVLAGVPSEPEDDRHSMPVRLRQDLRPNFRRGVRYAMAEDDLSQTEVEPAEVFRSNPEKPGQDHFTDVRKVIEPAEVPELSDVIPTQQHHEPAWVAEFDKRAKQIYGDRWKHDPRPQTPKPAPHRETPEQLAMMKQIKDKVMAQGIAVA